MTIWTRARSSVAVPNQVNNVTVFPGVFRGTDAEFVKFSLERGLRNLKGHRVAGGMRASLYNAMPEEGVLRLVETMKEFEAKHHV